MYVEDLTDNSEGFSSKEIIVILEDLNVIGGEVPVQGRVVTWGF